MSKPPAFQFYPSDFLIGVMMLSDEEVGIYAKMLCAQWLHGSLPNDAKLIKKMINSRKVPSDLVMQKFNLCDDGLLRNERLEIEREKQKTFRESRIENANKRWSKEQKCNASAMHVHVDSKCKTDALRLQSSSSSTKRVLSKDNTLRECEEIYQLYPKKVAKDDAIKAISKALARVSKETLTEAVTAYAKARIGQDPKFTPHPATWFNKARWEDDRTTWKDADSGKMNFGSKSATTYQDRHPNDKNEQYEIPDL
jgi:uncharacterized protein YdaU (DUF1376 family)